MTQTSVLVQLPSPSVREQHAAAPRLVELAPGQQALFGRGGPEAGVDVELTDPGVARLAGRIMAVEDHWLASNLSGDKTYVVENPEGAGEFVKVAPRRVGMPVPFEFARVVLPAADAGQVSFMVFAPRHTYADPQTLARPGGQDTAATFPLDETAKYFLVLVALCEPRLRDSSPVVIPQVPEIVARLRGLDTCRGITRAAVNFHIDYLAGTKLQIKQPTRPDGDGGAGEKADWQREALVTLALRFNLIREDHLALLPPPR